MRSTHLLWGFLLQRHNDVQAPTTSRQEAAPDKQASFAAQHCQSTPQLRPEADNPAADKAAARLDAVNTPKTCQGHSGKPAAAGAAEATVYKPVAASSAQAEADQLEAITAAQGRADMQVSASTAQAPAAELTAGQVAQLNDEEEASTERAQAGADAAAAAQKAPVNARTQRVGKAGTVPPSDKGSQLAAQPLSPAPGQEGEGVSHASHIMSGSHDRLLTNCLLSFVNPVWIGSHVGP